MDHLRPYGEIYAVLFIVAGVGGASWFAFFLAFESTREKFKAHRLVAAGLMPAVLAVAYCALFYGAQLNEPSVAHKALGTSATIGILGLPFWRFSLAVGRVSAAAIAATKDWHIEFKRGKPYDEHKNNDEH